MPTLSGAIAKCAELGKKVHTVMQATVDSVDEGTQTARVFFAGDPTIRTVRLAATKKASSVIVPAVKTKVIVAYTEDRENRGFIIGWEKIAKIQCAPTDEISISCGAGKVKITPEGIALGDGTEPLVLGNTLQQWAQSVDQALTAIITWGATGIAPGPAGGIAPLAGVQPSAFPPTALSEVNKTS